MLMGHAEGLPRLGSSPEFLLSDPVSEEEADNPTEILYMASFDGVKFERQVPLSRVIDIIIEQGCLQSMFGLHTFRIESVVRGKHAPVDELLVQGLYKPGLLRKVIITEASKGRQEVGGSWKPASEGTEVENMVASPSKARKVNRNMSTL
nr:TRNA (guanine(26)-N(2))-dimethyltransferase [Ipomoea batatas]